MREFELKWKNGLGSRAATSEGRRVGMIQRTDTPLCRSPVFEPSLSELTNLLDPSQQRKHDELIAANRRRRDKQASARSMAESKSAEVAAADALRGLLQLPSEGKPKADAAPDEDEEPPTKKRKKGAKKKAKAGAKKKSLDAAAVDSATTGKSSSGAAVSAAPGPTPGPVKLTVAMAEDSSDDEAYAVEVTAM